LAVIHSRLGGSRRCGDHRRRRDVELLEGLAHRKVAVLRRARALTRRVMRSRLEQGRRNPRVAPFGSWRCQQFGSETAHGAQTQRRRADSRSPGGRRGGVMTLADGVVRQGPGANQRQRTISASPPASVAPLVPAAGSSARCGSPAPEATEGHGAFERGRSTRRDHRRLQAGEFVELGSSLGTPARPPP